MNKEQFINELLLNWKLNDGISTVKALSKVEADLDQLIQDEIKRRVKIIGNQLDDEIKHEGSDFKDGCVSGFYFLKSKLLN